MSAVLRTYLAESKEPLTGPGSVATWLEISDYVGEYHISRGRQSEREAAEAGNMTLVLDDEEGRFDAENEASEFFTYYGDTGEAWALAQALTASEIHAAADLGSGIAVVGLACGEVWRSTDSGVAWALAQDLGDYVIGLVGLGSGVAVASLGNGEIWRSTDSGGTWALAQDLGANNYALANLGDGILIADCAGWIWRSTDSGVTWAAVQNLARATHALTGLGSGVAIAGLSVDGELWRSTDSGVTWALAQDLGSDCYALVDLGNGVALAGIGNGEIWRSVDYGATWALAQDLSAYSVVSLASLGSGVAVAGIFATGEIWRSIDSGVTWALAQDLGTVTAYSLSAIGSGVAIAGLDSGAVWRSVGLASSYADIGAQVKVELDVDGVITPVCVMYADEAPPSPTEKARLATWQFSDGSALLENASFVPTYSAAEQATGLAVGDCLGPDGLDWTGTTAIGRGTVDVQPVSAGEIQGIGERLNTVSEIENGIFFWARDGEPTFRDQDSRLANLATVVAVFSDEPVGDEIGYSDPAPRRARSDIENDWRITPTSGVEQVAVDAGSRQRYGRRTITKTQPFAQAAEALSVCQHRVAERKDPRTRIESLSVALADDETWSACCALELGDLVTLKRQGNEEPMIFEGLSLDQVKANGVFLVKLSPADRYTYWLIEDDIFGYMGAVEMEHGIW